MKKANFVRKIEGQPSIVLDTKLPQVVKILDPSFPGGHRRAQVLQCFSDTFVPSTGTSRSDGLYDAEELNYSTAVSEVVRMVWVDERLGETLEQFQARLDSKPREIIRRVAYEPICSDRFISRLGGMDEDTRIIRIQQYWNKQLAVNPRTKEYARDSNGNVYCQAYDLVKDSGTDEPNDQDYRNTEIPESLRAEVVSDFVVSSGKIFLPAEWLEAVTNGWEPGDVVLTPEEAKASISGGEVQDVQAPVLVKAEPEVKAAPVPEYEDVEPIL